MPAMLVFVIANTVVEQVQHDAQTENTSSSYRQKPLIYADLGTAPGKRPMAAPLSTHDHVVY